MAQILWKKGGKRYKTSRFLNNLFGEENELKRINAVWVNDLPTAKIYSLMIELEKMESEWTQEVGDKVLAIIFSVGVETNQQGEATLDKVEIPPSRNSASISKNSVGVTTKQAIPKPITEEDVDAPSSVEINRQKEMKLKKEEFLSRYKEIAGEDLYVSLDRISEKDKSISTNFSWAESAMRISETRC